MGDANESSKRPTRWFSRSRPARPDAADLGTCYGLELSLDPLPVKKPVRPAISNRRGPNWVQRLTSRPPAGR